MFRFAERQPVSRVSARLRVLLCARRTGLVSARDGFRFVDRGHTNVAGVLERELAKKSWKRELVAPRA
jgi:hypothetical protein